MLKTGSIKVKKMTLTAHDRRQLNVMKMMTSGLANACFLYGLVAKRL